MSDYYSDLETIRNTGEAYAKSCIAEGMKTPELSLFSGEWSDGLTGQDVLSFSGFQRVTFNKLNDFEQEDVIDAFEDGYYSANWPKPENNN